MNPSAITYHTKSRTLELTYQDDERAILSAEYLRVFSPSAEVRGHSDGERKLQMGKKHVEIKQVEPVGNYAVKIVFSDGHDTGIYSWDYLRELYNNNDHNWSKYLQELEAANASRLPTIPIKQWTT